MFDADPDFRNEVIADAVIASVNNALLLTTNRRDFEQVPGLHFENWMD